MWRRKRPLLGRRFARRRSPPPISRPTLPRITCSRAAKSRSIRRFAPMPPTAFRQGVRSSTPPMSFALRRGVCQDFAHIMISGMRGLGLPAAYVSGYLRTAQSAGEEQLEGAGAMHAWVLVGCGEDVGWRGLDPTNGIFAGDDHVVLAIGRDYADVAPIDGVIFASGGQRLEVSVSVTPVQ